MRLTEENKMADKDWTLKGFPLAMTIAGFTSWLVAAGIGTDIKHDRIKKEQENRAKTALIQSAPRADKSEGTLVSVVTGKPVENSKSRVNISRVNEYSYLDVYDNIIKQDVDDYNRRLNPASPLEYNLIKAMIAVEAGSIAERERAFRKDPMQLTDNPDTITILLKKGEFSYIIDDFSFLQGKNRENMDAETSIHGGTGWLFHKAAIYEFVERGDVLEYTVKPGDSFWKIAKEQGTSIGTLKKYNLKIVPEKLQIGQKLRFRKAKPQIVSWYSWKDAVARYNGSQEYADKVYNVKVELDNLDKLS